MRAAWTGYRSALAGAIEQYLAAKRALGCKFVNEDRALRLLDRFLVDEQIGGVDQRPG